MTMERVIAEQIEFQCAYILCGVWTAQVQL